MRIRSVVLVVAAVMGVPCVALGGEAKERSALSPASQPSCATRLTVWQRLRYPEHLRSCAELRYFSELVETRPHAAAKLAEALLLRPFHPTDRALLYYGLGAAHAMNRDEPHALQAWAEVAGPPPDAPAFHSLVRARYLAQKERFADALVFYRKAVSQLDTSEKRQAVRVLLEAANWAALSSRASWNYARAYLSEAALLGEEHYADLIRLHWVLLAERQGDTRAARFHFESLLDPEGLLSWLEREVDPARRDPFSAAARESLFPALSERGAAALLALARAEADERNRAEWLTEFRAKLLPEDGDGSALPKAVREGDATK